MITLLARRAKPTAVVPLGLAGALAMAIALAVFSAGAARADVLSPAPPASFDGQSASTGGGTQGSTVPDGIQLNVPVGGSTQAQQQQQPGASPQNPQTPTPVITSPAPTPTKVTVRVVCHTAPKTHTRTCRTYRNNALTKICTKHRHRH